MTKPLPTLAGREKIAPVELEETAVQNYVRILTEQFVCSDEVCVMRVIM